MDTDQACKVVKLDNRLTYFAFDKNDWHPVEWMSDYGDDDYGFSWLGNESHDIIVMKIRHEAIW